MMALHRVSGRWVVRRAASRAALALVTVLACLIPATNGQAQIPDIPFVPSAVEDWLSQIQRGLFGDGFFKRETIPKVEPLRPGPAVQKLTVDETMSLFLKQNLDLLLAHYGIDAAKGRQITARLFPNPTLNVNTLSAYTQGCNLTNCGMVGPSVSQLFEVAGKRGYRIKAADLEASSVEAGFEDVVRQLVFVLKDSYFNLQRQRGHLAIDQKALDILSKSFQSSGRRSDSDIDRVRLGLLTVNTEAEVLKDLQAVEDASGDLRVLLRLSPDVEIELETPLIFYPKELKLAELVSYAVENRPDIRARRIVLDKRKTELKLARVIPYPNVTAQLGYMVQGPHGPDNQQQWGIGFSVPLPVFDRNQGGIVEAEVAIRAAQTEVDKATVLIQNEVSVSYRRFLHARKLVDATNGAIEHSSMVFQAAQEGYSKKEVGILDLESARRSYGETEINHLDALFGYYESLFRLERDTGRTINF
ncbi:MAG: TolC family protein [Nitrospira sp. LK70]|nr:TolC family protein [Nitrospira sp. LK70]